MNIFDQYIDNIKKILFDLSKNGELILPDKLDGINTEIPPSNFKSDISTNVAMFLSKINNKPPTDLAEFLAKVIKKRVSQIILGKGAAMTFPVSKNTTSARLLVYSFINNRF